MFTICLESNIHPFLIAPHTQISDFPVCGIVNAKELHQLYVYFAMLLFMVEMDQRMGKENEKEIAI